MSQPPATPEIDLRRFVPYLHLLARKHFPQELRGRIDPTDVVQETLVDAYRALPGLRNGSTPAVLSWLRTILSHNILNLLRFHNQQRREVTRERSLEAALEQSSCNLGDILRAEQSSPSEQAQRHERALLVATAIADLPADQREAVIQRYWEGATLVAIAERLKCSETTASCLLDTALETLQPRLWGLQS